MIQAKDHETKTDRAGLEGKRFELGGYIRERSAGYSELQQINGLIHLRRNVLPSITDDKDRFVKELLDFAKAKAPSLNENFKEFLSFPKKYPLLDEYIDELDLRQSEQGWDCECYELT
ncbi:MAG: hypothetical protein GY869_29200 [Planctomycetes bacterium]|nr:hypothetical protein [Planctomycetota bacterium]